MDIWGFIKGMTFWNWLSLIAFIFFPLSALNAFFSLRSRYKDWRGLQNKKAFGKRLKELNIKVNKIVRFRKKPTEYYFILINHIFNILKICLGAAILFVIFIFCRLYPSTAPIIDALYGILVIVLLSISLVYAIEIGSLTFYISHPLGFINEVKHFIKNGRKKNVIDEDGVLDILEILFDNQLITVDEMYELKELVGISEANRVSP